MFDHRGGGQMVSRVGRRGMGYSAIGESIGSFGELLGESTVEEGCGGGYSHVHDAAVRVSTPKWLWSCHTGVRVMWVPVVGPVPGK